MNLEFYHLRHHCYLPCPSLPGTTIRVSDLVGLGPGPRICICNQFPGEAAAGGPHFESHGPIAAVIAIFSFWLLCLPFTPSVIMYTSKIPFLDLLDQGMVSTQLPCC